ncbi:MAG: PhnD/SsuA/transferrin family substrate-binding protein [Calditerrivibrio sp.]|nr:PhnD/SsuA/transferrin family substrate-binding protein [Calditerrivibrio sp.]
MNKFYFKTVFIKLLIAVFLLLFFISCGERDNIKKIDLSKTSEQKQNGIKKDNNTIHIGFDLRWEPIEDLQFYEPLIKFMQSETGLKFKIVIPRTYSDNIHMLGQGEIDISFMGTVNCLISSSKYGSYPIVVGLNGDNEPFYRSALVKKAGNSTIKTIKDLKNRKFAFGNKYSTQGYLIPRNMLENKDIFLEDLDYEFSDSHKDVAYKVINGFCDAGAMQDKLAFKMVNEKLLEIVELSNKFPSSTVCVSPLLDNYKVDIIKNALLRFNDKKELRGPSWKYTEMENGFIDVGEVNLKDLLPLIKRYYNLK